MKTETWKVDLVVQGMLMEFKCGFLKMKELQEFYVNMPDVSVWESGRPTTVV